MNLGAFMNPEFPIFSTTLCYLERDDAYLMLHRIKKQDDYNHDKWIGVGGKFERFESPEDCLLREVKEGWNGCRRIRRLNCPSGRATKSSSGC